MFQEKVKTPEVVSEMLLGVKPQPSPNGWDCILHMLFCLEHSL